MDSQLNDDNPSYSKFNNSVAGEESSSGNNNNNNRFTVFPLFICYCWRGRHSCCGKKIKRVGDIRNTLRNDISEHIPLLFSMFFFCFFRSFSETIAGLYLRKYNTANPTKLNLGESGRDLIKVFSIYIYICIFFLSHFCVCSFFTAQLW